MARTGIAPSIRFPSRGRAGPSARRAWPSFRRAPSTRRAPSRSTARRRAATSSFRAIPAGHRRRGARDRAQVRRVRPGGLSGGPQRRLSAGSPARDGGGGRDRQPRPARALVHGLDHRRPAGSCGRPRPRPPRSSRPTASTSRSSSRSDRVPSDRVSDRRASWNGAASRRRPSRRCAEVTAEGRHPARARRAVRARLPARPAARRRAPDADPDERRSRCSSSPGPPPVPVDFSGGASPTAPSGSPCAFFPMSRRKCFPSKRIFSAASRAVASACESPRERAQTFRTRPPAVTSCPSAPVAVPPWKTKTPSSLLRVLDARDRAALLERARIALGRQDEAGRRLAAPRRA